jgi:hypothetical protein
MKPRNEQKFYRGFDPPPGYTVIEPPKGTPFDSMSVNLDPAEKTATVKVWLDEPLYYITSPHGPCGIGLCGNSVLWWRVDGAGYTADIDTAWKLTRTEAERICSGKRGDQMFPVAAVDKMARREVHIDLLRQYEEEVANEQAAGPVRP